MRQVTDKGLHQRGGVGWCMAKAISSSGITHKGGMNQSVVGPLE
jgi:hypothetical protein